MEGWIKLHRDVQNHWIFKNSKYLRAWIYFLFRANYSDNKVLINTHTETIKRGQFITSLNHLSMDTQMTMQATRTFLNLLVSDNMIVKESNTQLTKITICNYDKYQDIEQTSNKPATNQQQTNNKRVTTVEESKEEKERKEKKDNRIPSLSDVQEYCTERKNNVDPFKWYNFYESKGWMIGKNKMIDWKAAVRTWETPVQKPRLMMP